MQRGLPSVSDSRRSHAGEKRKHRPPSLNHDNDDDDDVQVVGHYHPTSMGDASVLRPKARATPHRRTEFGDRQFHMGGEKSSHSLDQGSQRHQATVGHGQHQQSYHPKAYCRPSGHSRELGMAKGEQQHVSRDQAGRSHTLDEANVHGHDARSNKRQKKTVKVTFQ